jgi:hypothetical protein
MVSVVSVGARNFISRAKGVRKGLLIMQEKTAPNVPNVPENASSLANVPLIIPNVPLIERRPYREKFTVEQAKKALASCDCHVTQAADNDPD